MGETQEQTGPKEVPSSDLRPDIMVWSEENRMVWLFELTVCYKLNTEDTEQGRLRNTMTDHMNLGTEVTHVISIRSKLDREAISTQAALNL